MYEHNQYFYILTKCIKNMKHYRSQSQKRKSDISLNQYFSRVRNFSKSGIINIYWIGSLTSFNTYKMRGEENGSYSGKKPCQVLW